MQVLKVLTEQSEQRFRRVSELVEGISQKMRTQTLRQMERDGLVVRAFQPAIPPKVEFRLTETDLTLAEAFCGSKTGREEFRTDRTSSAEFDGRAL